MKHKKGIEVIATAKGYYDEKIREVGDVFEVHDDQELGTWMEPTNSSDKERISAAKSAGATKVIARNAENVVTENSDEETRKAAEHYADPGYHGQSKGKGKSSGEVM